MNVLMSIKPCFVEKIISFEKIYELRRTIFKKEVEHVVIYSSAPEKKIVGYFSPEINKDTPQNIWDELYEHLGIDYDDFFDYFSGKDIGFALKINNLKIFEEAIDTRDFDNFKAPQSFKYLNNNETEVIMRQL
ncbi:MAG: hypothetical protein LBM96_01730 [Methanobrevibacter sp.]|nr:hypothetical protein [Candidatus Methanoflexus mossambicus]